MYWDSTTRGVDWYLVLDEVAASLVAEEVTCLTEGSIPTSPTLGQYRTVHSTCAGRYPFSVSHTTCCGMGLGQYQTPRTTSVARYPTSNPDTASEKRRPIP
eukprot:3825417-Rhodomonas_salina.2